MVMEWVRGECDGLYGVEEEVCEDLGESRGVEGEVCGVWEGGGDDEFGVLFCFDAGDVDGGLYEVKEGDVFGECGFTDLSKGAQVAHGADEALYALSGLIEDAEEVCEVIDDGERCMWRGLTEEFL